MHCQLHCNTQVTITASTAHQATAHGRRPQHQEIQLPAAGRALRRPSSSRGGRGGALGASGCAAGGWRARRGGAACMRVRMEGEAGNTWEPALQTAWPAAKSAWGCTQACSATGLRRAPSRRARCCPPSAWVTPTAPAWALRLGPPPTVMRLGICGGGVPGAPGLEAAPSEQLSTQPAAARPAHAAGAVQRATTAGWVRHL